MKDKVQIRDTSFIHVLSFHLKHFVKRKVQEEKGLMLYSC